MHSWRVWTEYTSVLAGMCGGKCRCVDWNPSFNGIAVLLFVSLAHRAF